MLAAGQIQPGSLDKMRPRLQPENDLAVRLWNRLGPDPGPAAAQLAVAIYGVGDIDGLLLRWEWIRGEG